MLFKNILVPLDFSETSLHALRMAVRLARAGHSRITLLHVGVTPVPIVGDIWLPSSAEIYTTRQTQLVDEQSAALRRVARRRFPRTSPTPRPFGMAYPPRRSSKRCAAATTTSSSWPPTAARPSSAW